MKPIVIIAIAVAFSVTSMIGVLTIYGMIEDQKAIEQQRVQDEIEFQQKYLELENELKQEMELVERQKKMDEIQRWIEEQDTNTNNKSLEEALEEQRRKLDTTTFSQSLEDALANSQKTSDTHKPKTVIDKEEVQWTLYDSRGNQYYWTMPITSYESLVKSNYYPTMNLELPSGKISRVGDFTQYVRTSFSQVIDQIYDNAKSDEDFIYEVWYITSQLTVYSQDIGEDPRYALETLTRGGGDCEDTVILMADMIKSSSYTKNWKLQLVYFDSDNYQNPKNINHVALAIDMGDGVNLVFETTAKTNDGKNQWLGKPIYGYWFDV